MASAHERSGHSVAQPHIDPAISRQARSGKPALRIWALVRFTSRAFVHDEVLTRAAALAFYAALSLAPTFVVALWLGSVLGADARELVLTQIESVLGAPAAGAAADILAGARRVPSVGTISAALGLLTAGVSATVFFAQFQESLNRIWNVPKHATRGVRLFLRRRLLSLAMLLVAGALGLVSVGVTSVARLWWPAWGPLPAVGSFAGGVVVFTLVFVVIYKIVPDRHVATRDASFGAAMTAVLLAVGQEAFGAYVGRGAVGVSYGAAGSLMVVLLAVYYCGVVVLIGAELTQAYALLFGDGLVAKDRLENGNVPPGQNDSTSSDRMPSKSGSVRHEPLTQTRPPT